MDIVNFVTAVVCGYEVPPEMTERVENIRRVLDATGAELLEGFVESDFEFTSEESWAVEFIKVLTPKLATRQFDLMLSCLSSMRVVLTRYPSNADEIKEGIKELVATPETLPMLLSFLESY